MTKLRYVEFTLAVLCLGTMLNAGWAQEESEAHTNTNDQPRVIDEITVTEKRLEVLRKEVELAQDQMYKAFNEHNSDDELDVHCSRERPLGTRISRRVCRPVFVDTATSRAGDDLMQYVKRICPDPNDSVCVGVALAAGTQLAQEAYGNVAFMARRLDDEMQRLTHENAEVAKAVLEYQGKEREYQEALGRRGK